MKPYKKIEKNEIKEQEKEPKQSYVMKSHIYRYLMKRYNKHTVLDLGSGAFFDDADYAIDLYDDTAKDYCHFIKHDLGKAPYPLNKKFKTIKCFRTIEYLKNPRTLIKEAYRLLDDDGTLLILTTISKELNDKWIRWKEFQMQTNTMTNEAVIKSILMEEGFIYKTYYNSLLGLNFIFLQPIWRLINNTRIFFVCKKNVNKI